MENLKKKLEEFTKEYNVVLEERHIKLIVDEVKKEIKRKSTI